MSHKLTPTFWTQETGLSSSPPCWVCQGRRLYHSSKSEGYSCDSLETDASDRRGSSSPGKPDSTGLPSRVRGQGQTVALAAPCPPPWRTPTVDTSFEPRDSHPSAPANLPFPCPPPGAGKIPPCQVPDPRPVGTGRGHPPPPTSLWKPGLWCRCVPTKGSQASAGLSPGGEKVTPGSPRGNRSGRRGSGAVGNSWEPHITFSKEAESPLPTLFLPAPP